MSEHDISSLDQEKLQAILANAVDAIITIDEAGLIESVNPATEMLFGYTPAELIGRNVKILMPEPFRSEHDGYIDNYLKTGNKKIIGVGREIVGQRKDGSIFPTHLAVSEIRFGQRRFFTGIIRDITDLKAAERALAAINNQLEERVRARTAELKQMQADLLRSEKLATLGQIAGGIAHEIRNPLNAVKTSAYYLSHAQQLSPEKLHEHLERIDRQVTLIDHVITALTDVAMLPEPSRHSVDLDTLLRNTVAMMTFPGEIDIEYQLPADLPRCQLDDKQIIIAFKNLLRNARDAMPEGGKLIVGAEAKQGCVDVFFKDNGEGITESILSKIFEPLFTTKARGMGLGLAITRAIVEKNHCELRVASREGTGSCFTVRIPIE